MNAPKRALNSHYQTFQKMLEAKRDELRKHLRGRLADAVDDREPDDEGAEAIRSITTDMVIATIERQRVELSEIEAALKRLKAGEYGICEECGVEIPEVRLNALPWTRSCVDCADGVVRRNGTTGD